MQQVNDVSLTVQKKPQLDLTEEERSVWEMMELAKEVSECWLNWTSCTLNQQINVKQLILNCNRFCLVAFLYVNLAITYILLCNPTAFLLWYSSDMVFTMKLFSSPGWFHSVPHWPCSLPTGGEDITFASALHVFYAGNQSCLCYCYRSPNRSPST